MDPPSISSNSDSEITRTPSLLALSSFDPEDPPATRKLRFPDTEETTLPPCDLIESEISFLGLLSVPVMQNVEPDSNPSLVCFSTVS